MAKKNKKEFVVKTKFIFKGTFTIKASDYEEACELVEKNCGLVLGRDIYTALPDDVCVDWEFDAHSDKIVGDELTEEEYY
jgi:hypothetical protein